MSEKRRGLGRGLGALIPSGPATPPAESDDKGGQTSSPRSTPATTTPRTKSTAQGKAAAAPKKTSASSTQRKATKSAGTSGTGAKTASKAKASSSENTAASSQASATPSNKQRQPAAKRTAPSPSTDKRSSTKKAADVSRETSTTSKGQTSTSDSSAASNKTQGKAAKNNVRGRRDMGQALRSTTTVRRPVDMFFLPSDAAEKMEVDDVAGASSQLSNQTDINMAASSSENAGSESKSDADVSRETSKTAEVDKPENPRTTRSMPSEPKDSEGDSPSDADSANGTANVPTRVPSPGTDAVSGGTSGREESSRDTVNGPHTATSAAESDDVSRETSAKSDEDTDIENLAVVPGAQFAEVSVTDIHPNRKQPRQVFDEDELAELAFSVKELGVLQPVVVRPSREGEGAKYELVMGERRWRAVQKAGLDSIPAIIRETSDDDLLRDALLENLHRSQLNPLEEAAAYQQLLEEFGATQDELSQRIGRSRPQISNTLRLLRLPPLVQRRVAAGVLSSGHARALLGLTDTAEMERLAQRIVAEGMSVRATEETVALSDGLKRHATKRKTPTHRHDDRLNYIADAFSDRLDTSVKIQLGARKGKMTIEFASVEDLNRIIDVLDPKMEDRN